MCGFVMCEDCFFQCWSSRDELARVTSLRLPYLPPPPPDFSASPLFFSPSPLHLLRLGVRSPPPLISCGSLPHPPLRYGVFVCGIGPVCGFDPCLLRLFLLSCSLWGPPEIVLDPIQGQACTSQSLVWIAGQYRVEFIFLSGCKSTISK